MTASEFGSMAYVGKTPGRRPLVRLLRSTLFVFIFVIYIGALPFFIVVAPELLYGTYVVFGVCAVGILSFEWMASRSLLSMVPYLVWFLIFYCFWGTLVASGDLPLDEVVKTFVKNVVVLSALALAVIDRRDLARAARWFQIGALLNLVIVFWELWDPKLILTLALTRDPDADAFSVLRPAGLWVNPDEAAFALIFALLISYFMRGPLAWIGRLGCVIGIFLSASRTGVYVLAICGVVACVVKLRSCGFSLRSLTLLFLGFAALAAAVFVATESAIFRSLDISDQWQLMRILDFSEKTDQQGTDASRMVIAQDAINKALEKPLTGHGIYSFQVLRTLPFKQSVLSIGAHNVYITVWGEAGTPGILGFLIVLGIGIRQTFDRRISANERLVLFLMWVSYLVIGLTWHDQFIAFSGMLYIALLYHLPCVTRDYPEIAPPGSTDVHCRGTKSP
jgi:O-antigen ligase